MDGGKWQTKKIFSFEGGKEEEKEEGKILATGKSLEK